MNFFGHAVVSRFVDHAEYAGAAPYALGAMLPDFASMCGGRLESAGQAAVAAGVELHHRTDSVFHHHPRVLELMAELHERLARAGVSRGPARAGSHIGVELVLDGVLLDDGASTALYLEAISHSAEPLTWRDAGDAARFEALHRRLRGFGAPEDLRRPRSAAERLVRVLSRRPRLAPNVGEIAALASVLESFAPRVAARADVIVREVVASLSAPAVVAPAASASSGVTDRDE